MTWRQGWRRRHGWVDSALDRIDPPIPDGPEDLVVRLLREQTIQTNRWRERAETMARLEELEYRERCRLAVQLRSLGHVVTEPTGIR